MYAPVSNHEAQFAFPTWLTLSWNSLTLLTLAFHQID